MRKFVCEYCGFIRNFHGKEIHRFKKKVKGFTCPRCGQKQNSNGGGK